MGLADLESLIAAAKSAIVVIYNDSAYGADIYQYGSQRLSEKPMLIPEVHALKDWIDAGAQGTFVGDCRITSSVRALWLSEWMQASKRARRRWRANQVGPSAALGSCVFGLGFRSATGTPTQAIGTGLRINPAWPLARSAQITEEYVVRDEFILDHTAANPSKLNQDLRKIFLVKTTYHYTISARFIGLRNRPAETRPKLTWGQPFSI